jgi:hypothetical protein
MALLLPGMARAGESLDPAWIGTWRNVTPDAKNPRVKWVTTYTVTPDGDYTFEVVAGGKRFPAATGRLEAGGGKFRATPADGKPVSTGVYHLDRGVMKAQAYGGIELAWTRISAPPPAPAPHDGTKNSPPAPGPAPHDDAALLSHASEPSRREQQLNAIRATPLPGNVNGADARTLLLSDFPLPPGADEADLFCLPALAKVAGGGMQKRKFRVVK